MRITLQVPLPPPGNIGEFLGPKGAKLIHAGVAANGKLFAWLEGENTGLPVVPLSLFVSVTGKPIHPEFTVHVRSFRHGPEVYHVWTKPTEPTLVIKNPDFQRQ